MKEKKYTLYRYDHSNGIVYEPKGFDFIFMARLFVLFCTPYGVRCDLKDSITGRYVDRI